MTDEKVILLKECIHELKELVTKTVDSVYIKELEIMIKADLAKVRKAEIPVSVLRQRINSEIKHVDKLLHTLALEIKGISRGNKDQPEDEDYRFIPATVVETRDGTHANLLSKLKLHEIGKNPTSEEAMIKEIAPVYTHILKERLLEEYLSFLITVSKEILLIAEDPEYWKIRSEETPKEPEILDIMDKAQLELQNKIPGWRQHLIDKGFVFDDGRRVARKLDYAAAELVKFTKEPVTSDFLHENFLKKNGNSYSKKACDNARDYANTNTKN